MQNQDQAQQDETKPGTDAAQDEQNEGDGEDASLKSDPPIIVSGGGEAGG